MSKAHLSQLRRQVAAKLNELRHILEPAFDDEPVLPGVVTVS
jgi:hypothetical protein